MLYNGFIKIFVPKIKTVFHYTIQNSKCTVIYKLLAASKTQKAVRDSDSFGNTMYE